MPRADQTARTLARPLCALLRSRHPLVLTGAGPALWQAAAEAGALALFDEVPASTEGAAPAPFGARLQGADEAATLRAIERLAALGASVVALAQAAPAACAQARARGLAVLCDAATPAQALAAQAAGAHALRTREDSLGALLESATLPLLLDSAPEPDAIAAALSQGAQGVLLRVPAAGRPAPAWDRLAGASAALLGAEVWQAPPLRLSSPVCYAEELDRAWRDVIDRVSLVDALNELLLAERAGARAAFALLRAPHDARFTGLLQQVHRDELRWCGMLMAALHGLGATPSARTGAFFDKVMALPELPARLALLNRGQAWVVRRLQALAPRVDDEPLRAALEDMLAAHQHNIAALAAELP